jgi:outer membrane protein assembly factor BamB
MRGRGGAVVDASNGTLEGSYTSTGNVYALNAATGQQLWTVNAGDGLLIVPAGNQVVAYILSTNPEGTPRSLANAS